MLWCIYTTLYKYILFELFPNYLATILEADIEQILSTYPLGIFKHATANDQPEMSDVQSFHSLVKKKIGKCIILADA